MQSTAATTWHAANYRALLAALAPIRGALQAALAVQSGEPPAQPDLPIDIDPLLQSRPAALQSMCAQFGLAPFERDLLLLCAGVELDPEIARLCGRLQGDPQRPAPTFKLALAVLPQPYWQALTPGAALRRWRLIEIGNGPTLMLSPLRIDEWVLHVLTGCAALDERLAGLISAPLEGEGVLLTDSQQQIAEQVQRIWRQQGESRPLIQLFGADLAGKRAIAAAAAQALGWNLGCLDAALLPTNPAELETIARLWEREARLNRSALLIDCADLSAEESARMRSVTALTDRLGEVCLAVRERSAPGRRPVVAFDVPPPPPREQRAIWQRSLGEQAPALNGQLEALVAHFNLSAAAIASAAAEGMSRAEPGLLGAAIWHACRMQSRPRLEHLAQRIESRARMQDLVLPELQLRMLNHLIAHARHRFTVYEEWGFAERDTRGLNIAGLFSGPSGTGKTLAAEVIANELQLDLYRVDLSRVVNKYIGETEKNLQQIFDAAEEGGVVLLFDEADALFGKRSEVKDSHDRYANIQVDYLLQRLEAYRGLAILTTNMKQAIDPAFTRRLRFHVQFPFPDAALRRAIWRQIFPPGVPMGDLAYDDLARLNITGGTIRNIALHAAFLAADDPQDRRVRMVHLRDAARVEYAKMEQNLTETEIGGWKV